MINNNTDRKVHYWIFLFIVIAGLLLKTVLLDIRPLHGDEGVGAMMSKQFIELGSNKYISANRHGPLQYYLAGISMAIIGDSENALRLPFALAGALVPILFLFFRKKIGTLGVAIAATFFVCSPTFLFYSRYAIQEIYLVLFTGLFFTAMYHFLLRGNGNALLALILSAALMVTVKETFVIIWGCLACSVIISYGIGGTAIRANLRKALQSLWQWKAIALGGIIAGILIIVATYSDGFCYWLGVNNLIINLTTMLSLGATENNAMMAHHHPSSYYVNILLRYEMPIIVFGAIGLVLAIYRRTVFFFTISVYTVLIWLIHFFLDYKVPWLLLTPLFPLVLLSGYSCAVLYQMCRKTKVVTLIAPVYYLAALMVLVLSFKTSFSDQIDPNNLLAYHHAGPDQKRLAQDIIHLTNNMPGRISPKVSIHLPYAWPLAWYLRNTKDIVYSPTPIQQLSKEYATNLPAFVTLSQADPRFLRAFLGIYQLPPYQLPSHNSSTYILIPPNYNVGSLWIRNDLVNY